MNILLVREAPGQCDANDTGLAGRSDVRWIVCAGATRDVSRGRVKCPRRGIVSATECLACHLLVTLTDERDLRLACSTAE